MFVNKSFEKKIIMMTFLCFSMAIVLDYDGAAAGRCTPESCNGQSSDGCWCDNICVQFGDCCENVCEVCADVLSECGAKCGNGTLDNYEKCDDGNTIDGDGCASNCLAIEKGYECQTVGQPCNPIIECGNGIVEGSEECDDGGSAPDDGCSAVCTVEAGYTCNEGSPTICSANPTISISSSILSFTKSGSAIQIDSSASANDADGNADWDGGTLAIRITANGEAEDEISIPDNVVGTINTNGTDLLNGATVFGIMDAPEGTVTKDEILTITFNSSATNALVQQTLRALHFQNTSDNPGTNERIITFTLMDKNSGSADAIRKINVIAVNKQPSDIILRGTSVDEEMAPGTGVGTLETTAPEK